MHRVLLAAAAALLLSPAAAQAAAPTVSIKGNKFVDASRQPLRLLGVNGGLGSEFTCVEPIYNDFRKGGVFDGPATRAEANAIASWRVNTVRVQLNEDCWLGINPVRRTEDTVKSTSKGGAKVARSYRKAITRWVGRLHAAGLITILDLHWTAPGSTLASGQWRLADTDHSLALWRSVAKTFRKDRSMVYDVFNEPVDNKGRLSWRCLRDGCRLPNSCADCATSERPDGTYRAAGTQSLVDAIRSTGARQPIMVPGRDYSNDLSKWLRYLPRDPLHQLAASFHNYPPLECNNQTCWDGVIANIAATHPVVTGEFGQDDCGTDFDTTYMDWADQHGVGYTAWWWMVGDVPLPDCHSLDLIADFGGTPRPNHGVAVHDHFAALADAQGASQVR